MLFRRYPLKNYPYALPKPLNEYSTNYIWSGLRCLNPHIQKCYVFFPAGELIERKEVKYPDHLSRVDYMEEVHVKIYNENMYSENDELFVKYVVEAGDSNSPQHSEVETRPLTQTPPRSMHAGVQHLSTLLPSLLHPEAEQRFGRLLAQHVKQDPPSASLSDE